MILIDENLSDKLPLFPVDLFPAIVHVKQLGLVRTPDREIWAFARAHGMDAILTADSDLRTLALQLGAPPKVIQILDAIFQPDRPGISCGAKQFGFQNS